MTPHPLNQPDEYGLAVSMPVTRRTGTMAGYLSHVQQIQCNEAGFPSYQIGDVWFDRFSVKPEKEDHTKNYRLMPYRLLYFEQIWENGHWQEDMMVFKKDDQNFGLLRMTVAPEHPLWQAHPDILVSKLTSLIRWWSLEDIHRWWPGSRLVCEYLAPRVAHFLGNATVAISRHDQNR